VAKGHGHPLVYIKANTVSVRLSVWTKIGQCLEDSSNHYPFPVECFEGWGKGKPGEARGWGGQQGGGPAWTGGGGEGDGRGRTGRGGQHGRGGGAWARKDRAGGGAARIKGMDEMSVWLDDETNFEETFFFLAIVRPD
jgi:hypothetical protein